MQSPKKGRIFLRMKKEDIEGFDKVQLAPKVIIQIVKFENPNDYSIEAAVVEDINPQQTFFRPGDIAIVHYMVFTAGKHGDRIQNDSYRIEKLPNGDEIYWCYDGTDGVNETDVLAKIEGDKIIPHPGWLIVAKPEELAKLSPNQQNGSPVAKRTDKTIWTEILAVNPDDQQLYGISPGEKLLIKNGVSRVVILKGAKILMAKIKYAILTA